MLALGCNLSAIGINEIHYVALKVGNVIIGCRCRAIVIGQTVRHPDVVVVEVQRFGDCAVRNRFPQQLDAGVDVAVVCGNLCRRPAVERLPGIPVLGFVFRFIRHERIGLRRLLEEIQIGRQPYRRRWISIDIRVFSLEPSSDV